ncbi:hypothetical protein QE152_g13164 [Popillia japonica]|uniref:Uncharacterized protein n=1 Tax=Popillia japonica TaxID=7064 RepID=A0AAW1LEL7_POPJA
MTCLNSIVILLLILPISINSESDTLEKTCYSVNCTRYKSNKTECDHSGHIADPFNNECVPKCDGPCINGYCQYCICHSTNTDVLISAQPSECKRLMYGMKCTGDKCGYHPITTCNSNYTANPYDKYECLERCDEDSCGEGGKCSSLGRCICRLGYRPDITNPRHCVKAPENNRTTTMKKTCHNGFKLNDDGECVSSCGDCQYGCCGRNGVCRCWHGYRLDVTRSTCVKIKNDDILKTDCSDRCSNGVCDSDGVCQCPVCSDSINKTVNCQIKQNGLVNVVANADSNLNCANITTSSEDMISESTHRTYIAILSCFTLILLMATIALMVMIVKVKRALPQNEGKVKILFGKVINHG